MMLTQERLKQLLHYDAQTGAFTWKVRGCKPAGSVEKGYVRIRVDEQMYRAHRLAWLYVYGAFPRNQIDHRDGNRGNNAIANLREATNGQNQQNVIVPRSTNKVGLRGVSWRNRPVPWQASIVVGGQKQHLGTFSTAQEAHQAYLAAKAKFHPFAARLA